jgi:hypothetical protein
MLLTSHNNEYVGLLRERLAKQIGCSLVNVRMFCMGELCKAPGRVVEVRLLDPAGVVA